MSKLEKDEKEFDNGYDENENDQDYEQPKNNRKTFLKKMGKFLFSHVGLVVMVVIYAVAGAFLFQLLEQHEEAKNCEEGKGEESSNIVELRSELLKYIQFNISMGGTDPSKDNETVANDHIETLLLNYRDDVLTLRSTYLYTGQDCSVSRWDFANTLLFSVTVFTTIGIPKLFNY